jgi:hypothetical protein
MGARLRSWWQKIKSRLVVVRRRWLSLWKKIKQHPYATGVVVLVLLVLILFIFLAYKFGWDWTGFNGGESKVTKTPQGTTTEYSPRKTLWDWLLLGSSVATTLAIVAAGWWFITNRSLAGSAEISLSLKDVAIINGIRIAIVGVRIKNLGHTKIEKQSCIARTKAIDVEPDSEGILLISEEPDEEYDLPNIRDIFGSLNAIEPNEEVSRDIAFSLGKITSFKVSVIFIPEGTNLTTEGTKRSWESVAVFNVDDKAKVPTPPDFSAILNVKIPSHWTTH